MSPAGKHKDVRLVGLVFCQPYAKLAKEEILPALRYFHRRSGQHVNFYFPGYYAGWEAPPGDIMAAVPADGPGWIFSADAFDDFRRELENSTAWKYSGGTDFILANAKFDREQDTAYLDLSSALSINFEQLQRDGALQSVGMLFESIFSYAESCDGTDPAWGFSDKMGGNLIASSIKNLVVSVLPSAVQPNAKGAFHFVSKDLALK